MGLKAAPYKENYEEQKNECDYYNSNTGSKYSVPIFAVYNSQYKHDKNYEAVRNGKSA